MSKSKRSHKSADTRLADYYNSVSRSYLYYERNKKNSEIIHIDFMSARNFSEVIDWLRNNIRNIRFNKTRSYGTAWWTVKNNKGAIIGIGFKDKANAVLFKLSGICSNENIEQLSAW